MRAKRVYECRACADQCSVTAGTIFYKTRVPLRSGFWALYRVSQDKKGISAMRLSQEIECPWSLVHWVAPCAYHLCAVACAIGHVPLTALHSL
jgi:hypothetical protein